MTFYKRTKLHEGDLCRVKITVTEQGTPTKYDFHGILQKIRHNDCIIELQKPIQMNCAPVKKITVRKKYVFPAKKETGLVLTETAEYICNYLCKIKAYENEEVFEKHCSKCKLETYLDALAEC